MKMKKCLSMILAIVMIATMITSLPITANAVDVDTAGTAEDTVIDVSTADELKAACTEINTNGGNYTINLTDDIEGYQVSITKSDAVVTVIGNGHTVSSSESAVYVANGATVNLGDGQSELILTSVDNNDTAGIVDIQYDSFCNMYDKVTLKDHKGDNYFGGGVTVKGGTFHMYGGTIENCGIGSGSVCYGGGVAVIAGGSFIMDNGTITKCYVRSDYTDEYDPNRCFTAMGGGVFVTAGSSFTMNGGTISNCEATNMGGGIAMASSDSMSDQDEWDLYRMGNPKSNVTINNGTISGNKAWLGAGIFVSGYFYAFSSAFEMYPQGTGLTDNPGLYINGGTIEQNEAEDMGGGILVAMIKSAAKIQIHNAFISSNKADNGAGIESFGYWTQMDIDGCTISDNSAVTKGGGIMLSTNGSGGYTNLKNTTVIGDTSGDKGAGVYYDTNSKLNISGANIIQNNTYNGKQNNLNILSLSKPVYVNGDLTGSQIGLSDPTLWDDNLSDEDAQAVSTDYLTSGYKAYNTANPSNFFTSDHETWVADYSDVNPNEVRLVRKTTVDYHINNQTIADAKYEGKDIFTDEIKAANANLEVVVGETIDEFYTVPEVVPTAQNSCPYIFKGWYYDKANDDDSHPVVFDTDIYTAGRDIYAHWITVEDNIARDPDDPYSPNKYGGFDLAGVQIRRGVIDTNFGEQEMPGGMRFITSLSKKVVNEINKLKSGGNNIEYGYVAATDTNKGWINYHNANSHKLQYVSESANGSDTSSSKAPDETYFGFAKNVNCTSKESNNSDNSNYVARDHRSYDGYLLYTLVVTYEGATVADKAKNILARPYIHYTDANGLERVAYSEYNGVSHKLGGCYTNYDSVVKISL